MWSLPLDDMAEHNPLGRITHCRKIENPTYYKVVIAADSDETTCLWIPDGNHFVAHTSGKALPDIWSGTDLSIAHFPVRSPSQIMAKAICGWLAYLAKDPNSAASEQGYQKRDLFEH